MKFVDKNHEAEANAIITPYLHYALNQPWYGNDLKFGRESLYERMRGYPPNSPNEAKCRSVLLDRVLLPEQNNRCCYCMRRIDDHSDDASIEHIIPKSVDTYRGMMHYFNQHLPNLNSRKICLTDTFVASRVAIDANSPFPHLVAYHNFAAACRKCNSSRGHEEIEVLFLHPNIHNEIEYNNHTGEAFWALDPVYSPTARPEDIPTLETLKLNRPLYKAIRATWFQAKREGINPTTLTTEQDKSDLIYKSAGAAIDNDPKFDDKDFRGFMDLTKAANWSIFLKFDYFGR